MSDQETGIWGAANGATIDASIEIAPHKKRPAAGNEPHRFAVTLKRSNFLIDPDGAKVYTRLVRADGTVMATRLYSDYALAVPLDVSAHASFPAGSGWYEQATSDGQATQYVKVTSAGADEALFFVHLWWLEDGRTNGVAVPFTVGDAADLDQIATDAAAAAAGAVGLGLGTDAVVAPGVLGTAHAHLRGAQVAALAAQAAVESGTFGNAALKTLIDAAKAVVDAGATTIALAAVALDAAAAKVAAEANTLELGNFGLSDAATEVAAVKTQTDKIGDGTIGLANLKALIDAKASTTALAAKTVGARKSSWSGKVAHSGTLGNADPTDGELTVATTQGTSYTILYIKDVVLPEGALAQITDFTARIKWSGIVAGAGPKTGSTRWETAPASNVQIVGDVSTGDPFTAPYAETVAKATKTMTVYAEDAALPASNGMRLFLTGLVTDAGDTLTATVFDSSEFVVTQAVPTPVA